MSRITRTITLLLVFLLAASVGYLSAQRVNASEIIAKINAGEAVSYTGVTIVGDLDMTKLDNTREAGFENKGKEFLAVVRVPLRFVDCTFEDKVLGYVSNNGMGWNSGNNPVYNTDFREAVVFENCRFEDDAHFKYSEFNEGASFRGSEFRDDALFKYSDFREAADFSDVRFRDANFKYTEFPRGVTFAGARFRGDATFKYTELRQEVSFAGAIFEGEANFKYIKFPAGTNLTNTSFGRHTDFKYATLGGKKFSR